MGTEIVPINPPEYVKVKYEHSQEDKMGAIVIINEQHTLLEAQENLLWESGLAFDQCLIPATGLQSWEQLDMINWLMTNYESIVFVSPLPLMIKEISSRKSSRCVLMCNDTREKKELPNGKIIYTVSQTGWYLA
jgi:hypothetical protein